MEDARISCEQLAQLLDEEPKLVLLDVRSFVLFNQSHLRDAVNVCVPRTLAKRPGFNIKNLEAGICKKCEKDLFRTREGHVVVLYDQTGDDADASGLLAKCFEALSAEGLCSAVYWVQGGFASIQAELSERVEATRKQDEQLSKPSAPGLALPRGLAAAAGPGAFPRLPMAAFTAPANPSPNEKIVQITEYLYLSGSNIAEDLECLKKNHIRYIVNSAQELDNYFSATNDFVYTRLDLQDHPRQAICFEKIFDFAFKAIDEAKRSGCRALVHCRGGKSRSATVVIAYLMRTYDWSLQQAYEYVQKKSPKISPNLGFMGQLLEYEKYLSRKRGSPVPAGKVPSPQVMPPSAIHRQLGGSPLCSPDIKREQTTPPLWSISSLSLRT